MQRGEVVRRHASVWRVLPCYVFHYLGLRRFYLLQLWRSGALFSDSPWASVSSLEVLFFRFGAKVLFRPH